MERERHGRDSGEIRRLLNSLECKQDEYTRSMILHNITRCVYLLEAEVERDRAGQDRKGWGVAGSLLVSRGWGVAGSLSVSQVLPSKSGPWLAAHPLTTTVQAASSDLSL